MRITFLLPCYPWVPMGGFRVVYEYANQLAGRGHQVTVIHPRRVKYHSPAPASSLYGRVRDGVKSFQDYISKPSVNWHRIDKRVRMLYPPTSDEKYIPEGDAIFATAWNTVRSVLECPPSKGEKFYLIQHYETWMGPKDLVDATWRAPLHKVVIAKWLLDLGKELGADDFAYIPNAINHDRYRLVRPIGERPRQLAMMFSTVPFKGSANGIEAIWIARKRFPSLKVVFFGTSRRQRWIPDWVEYHRNPHQDFIVNEIYNRSCMFLCPSLSEGWPLPPAEAACCGCAIVATSNGGILDYIEHGITGLLSPPKDPAALAENLCLLLENEDLRITLANACHDLLTGFTWEHSTDLLEQYIAKASHGGPNANPQAMGFIGPVKATPMTKFSFFGKE